MKITVLGAGSSACLTALHYAYYTRLGRIPIEIELIHDPNIPPVTVGLATLLNVPELLWDSWLFNWHDNLIDAVPKFGILYEGWGNKREKSFASPLPFSQTAMHLPPDKLQKFILDSGVFKVIEGNIENYGDIDSDFIFDCRGAPTDWDDYEKLENPINSVLLSTTVRDYNQLWSKHIATPNGYTFSIPLLDSTSLGYLYNDGITDEDDAIDNFKEMFGVDEIEKMKFHNYLAKSPIIDNRIILNGNRLFFIEPLEATSLTAHLEWCRWTWDWIVTKKFDQTTIEHSLVSYINQIKNFIIWHYQAGSKYDTPFWDYAKNLIIDDPVLLNILRTVAHPDFLAGNQDWVYGQWQCVHFKFWNEGILV